MTRYCSLFLRLLSRENKAKKTEEEDAGARSQSRPLGESQDTRARSFILPSAGTAQTGAGQDLLTLMCHLLRQASVACCCAGVNISAFEALFGPVAERNHLPAPRLLLSFRSDGRF